MPSVQDPSPAVRVKMRECVSVVRVSAVLARCVCRCVSGPSSRVSCPGVEI
jgi:hypothetical protein